MTKYTILEDCPLGAKGDEVETDVDGCIIDKNKNWYTTPFDIFFAQKLGVIKEKDETPKRWEPFFEQKYWYIGSDGEVMFTSWGDTQEERNQLAFGNVFRTREEAEAKAEQIKKILKS